jgi:hypothetical protein
MSEVDRQLAGVRRQLTDAIVVAAGAPLERVCPPWVLLGVKAIEARGVHAA